jgi:hypothetical protein
VRERRRRGKVRAELEQRRGYVAKTLLAAHHSPAYDHITFSGCSWGCKPGEYCPHPINLSSAGMVFHKRTMASDPKAR